MKKSFLNQISPIKTFNVYSEWHNGKLGAITDTDGLTFRFLEMDRDDNGHLYAINKNEKDCPIVIVGIVAWWIRHRDNKSNRFINEFKKGKVPYKGIKAQFESYTEMRYEQFKAIHKDDPNTWNWNWDYEFYAKYIIPHEAELNRQAKKLFEFISDSEIELVSSVMTNYIEYLKMCRSELGYNVPDELKVLRSLVSGNNLLLEDLEDYEVNVLLDKLEKGGYVKVAWVEGHKPEGVRLLDKGRVYIRHLETEVSKQGDEPVEEKPIKHSKPIKQPKSDRHVDIDKIGEHFKLGFDKETYLPIMKTLLEASQSEKNLARAALLIYESKDFMKSDYNNIFADWYRDFCKFVGCGYHSDYCPSALIKSIKEEEKHKYYFLL